MPLTSSFKLSKSLSHLSSRVSDLEAENEDLKERLRFLDFQRVSEWQANRDIITNLESKYSHLLTVYTEDKFESAVRRLTNSMMEDIATERMEHIKTHGSGWSMIDNLLKDHPDQENKIINVLKGNQDTRDQVESYASNTLRGYYKRTIDSGYGEYPSTWRSKLESKAKARMAKSLKDPHLFVLSIQLGDGDDIVAEVVKSSLKVGALPVDEIIRETMFTR
ncbi:hypothetical protein V865_002198 [Kwoniella europaea PYCC6329]|uniref:Uncharacterized protein n=1 Tax=Kwoniella europaea PYCC6329 TaxID=1423913 RepID=A0AAX4KEM0_9TREE